MSIYSELHVGGGGVYYNIYTLDSDTKTLDTQDMSTQIYFSPIAVLSRSRHPTQQNDRLTWVKHHANSPFNTDNLFINAHLSHQIIPSV